MTCATLQEARGCFKKKKKKEEKTMMREKLFLVGKFEHVYMFGESPTQCVMFRALCCDEGLPFTHIFLLLLQ